MPDAEDGAGVREDAVWPRVIRRGIDSGGLLLRGAAGLRFRRRSAHGRKTQLAQGEYVTGGKLRGVKRPACFHRQTGACRSCGLAVSQPCRRREEPVWATDLFATGRRTPTGWWRTGRGERSVPDVQRRERSTPNRQTSAQRVKRSTPTARPVSSDGSDQLPTTGRVSNGRRA